MTSEPLSIPTNESGCTTFPEVWNVWNVTQNGYRVGCTNACQVFGAEKLFAEQFKSLKTLTFVSGVDVLLNLPTGFGKSLVFQVAP